MKSPAWILLVVIMAAGNANAKTFTLDKGYVRPDGAILTYYNADGNVSDMIDPYFPTKALLTAHDSGMNIQFLASGWIKWVLARQEEGGLISRFCHDADANDYQPCLIADADDSMMALWIDLLYRMAPSGGMPASWKESARKAQQRLDELYDTHNGVYTISNELPVALLMDNVEIYGSLTRASKEAKRLGETKQADTFSAKAKRLKAGILRTFWDAENGRFKISTQARNGQEFYPDIVAQIFPMLYNVKADDAPTAGTVYHAWMREHRQTWMNLIGKDFPWGQVALLAAQYDDPEVSGCWFAQAAPHRHSGLWSVLDEAAFQSTEHVMQKKWPGVAASCKESTL